MNIQKIRKAEALFLSATMLFSMAFSNIATAENTVNTKSDRTTPSTMSAEISKTTFPVHVVHKSGNDKENFVIVIMGDGYTAEQQDQFVEDASKKAQGMLTWSPYKEYSDHINIYAVQAVSNESGISVYGGKSVDTYFHIKVYGKATGFTNGGDEKAKALRQELEENYLDAGASVGTIHILSNTDGNYGASINSLFSFSTNSSDNIDGTAMTHEIAHSIGGLGDEYERYTNKPNTSDTTNPDTIKWSKLLGFRGVGVTTAGTETAFAPSRECMMRWLGQPFCEVCKMELARKFNNPDYVSTPNPLYVGDPEITIPHSKTGTLDHDSEKYRVTEKNITKANDTDLEFRTVVQNMVNSEQHLKLSLRITNADGTTIKYQEEKSYTIPALSNWYDPDAARESLSLVLTDVSGLANGDRIMGQVINTDTGEILATDKTAEQTWSTVTLHYQLNLQDGTSISIPQTSPAIVYVPLNSTYALRNPKFSGYTCVGNSAAQDQIKVTENNMDVTYYYQIDTPEPAPSVTPSATPTTEPTNEPVSSPSATSSSTPSRAPTTATPSVVPSKVPTTTAPSAMPSKVPTTTAPSARPSRTPSTTAPSVRPSGSTTTATPPTVPSKVPTTTAPSAMPSSKPTATIPSASPSETPSTTAPSARPIAPTATASQKPNHFATKSTITVIVKPTVTKNSSQIKNINTILRKAISKAEKKAIKQGKPVTIRVQIITKQPKGKSLSLKLSKATINYLVKKKVKSVQWVNGRVRVTINQKTLKKIKRRKKSSFSLVLRKMNYRLLPSKIKKAAKGRPVYELTVKGVRAKKKRIFIKPPHYHCKKI